MRGAGFGATPGRAPPPADAAEGAPGLDAAVVADMAALAYRLRWRVGGLRPGVHGAAGEGGEGAFRRLVSLIDRPDPRRIDVRALARDPFEAVRVRAFAPRRAVTVGVLVDVSASMGFDGANMAVATFCAAIAAAAEAAGDSFTLAAADAQVRADLAFPPVRRRGVAQQVFGAVIACGRAAGVQARSARGLAAAVERLPRRRGMVFLVSDFLMPPADIALVLDALVAHDVVPVVVRDSRAEGDVPAFGLMDARDAETGARRLVVLRPSLRARWRREAEQRLAGLEALFAARGLPAFHLLDRFDGEALVHFLGGR
ncbi:hypothetical protein ACI7BZ_06595 [Xanthobacter sp. AM11]|uniref:DUF58 domain-containing protein n=1 Tax=Xanthobacter sp. AM11 TaxID=3380643 RepID=UPI0039BFD8BD